MQDNFGTPYRIVSIRLGNTMLFNIGKIFENKEYKLQTNVSSRKIDNEKNLIEVTLSNTIASDGNIDPNNIKPGDQNHGLIVVEMLGVFEIGNDVSDEDIELFTNINAPAVLYSNLRPIVRSLTSDSGYNPPLFLPFMNFEQRFKEMKEQINEPSE